MCLAAEVLHGVVDDKHTTCWSCSCTGSAECDVTVNLKIIFFCPVGTSQETGDHADQAKGLLEEDGEFGALTCSRRLVVQDIHSW